MANEQLSREPIKMSDDEQARRKAELQENLRMQQAAADASKRASEAAVQPPRPLGPNAITEVPGFEKPTKQPGTTAKPEQQQD